MGSSDGNVLTEAFGESVGAWLQYVSMGSPSHFVENTPCELPIFCTVPDSLLVGVKLLLSPETYDQIWTAVTGSELVECARKVTIWMTAHLIGT